MRTGVSACVTEALTQGSRQPAAPTRSKRGPLAFGRPLFRRNLSTPSCACFARRSIAGASEVGNHDQSTRQATPEVLCFPSDTHLLNGSLIRESLVRRQ